MNFTEIIAAIQKSEIENKNEVATALNGYIDSLNSESQAKISGLQSSLENLTKAVGVETGTNEERLILAQSAIAKLTNEKDTLAAATAKLEVQVKESIKRNLIEQVASKSKASSVVLSKLIGDEELAIAEDGNGTIDGKQVKEWVQAKYPEFVPAAFAHSALPKLPQLPNSAPHETGKTTPFGSAQGTPETSEEKEVSAVDQHLKKFYKKPDFLL